MLELLDALVFPAQDHQVLLDPAVLERFAGLRRRLVLQRGLRLLQLAEVFLEVHAQILRCLLVFHRLSLVQLERLLAGGGLLLQGVQIVQEESFFLFLFH